MKTRNDILQLIPKNSICAEIGVFEGVFSEEILRIVNPSMLYMVDIFTGTMCSGDMNGNNMKYVNLDLVYNGLVEKYKNTESVKIYKGTSTQFFSSIPDNHLDFVYVDGEHSYSTVISDLRYSHTKVKQNGRIAGHDYCARFPEVIKAVDEFCSTYKYIKHLTSDDGISSFLLERSI